MSPIPRHRLALSIVLTVAFAATAGPPGPSSGKILVLDNDQVVEGQIDRVGDRYRIVRDGGETSLPASRVLWLGVDRTGACEFLKGRIDARDANAHLRLARWCASVELRTEALDETRAALSLKPAHAEALRFLKHLETAPILPTAATVPAPSSPAAVAVEPAPVEVGAETFKRFVTKVQPVLMNACANCHAASATGTFKLQRVFADGLNNRAATHLNLATVATQIDRANPTKSKLLTMAVTAHGGATVPPLRDRSATPYRQIDEWVALVAAERTPIPSGSQTTTKDADPPLWNVEAKPPAKDEQKGGPVDPFDPAIFNQQYYPGKVRDASEKRP